MKNGGHEVASNNPLTLLKAISILFSMNWQPEDVHYMRLALRLARRGAGRVLPNPMVGAVVVKNRQVLGQGYHRFFGGPHAEVEALQKAGRGARGSTLYVTLEPCNHQGKTPPCTQKIIAAGIRRVVIAMSDPNPLVNGSGIRTLQKHGIEVELGLLEKEARALNAAFVKFITRKQPFVFLKLAQTLDGKIADRDGKSQWISGPASRKLGHRWRMESGAVLVGIGTVLLDNPRLTVRHVKGPQPRRIVLDTELRIPLDASVVSDEYTHKTVVCCAPDPKHGDKKRELEKRRVQVVPVERSTEGLNLEAVLQTLARMNIAQVLIEGGQQVTASLLRQHLVDRMAVFFAPKLFGQGKPGVELPGFSSDQPLAFKQVSWRRVGEDMLFLGEPVWD